MSGPTVLPLAGTWQFALDPENAGIRERWFERSFDDSISLPGTTDEAQKGEYVDERCDDRLSRVWRWIGPAWYQRTIDIPQEYEGQSIRLFLERTKDSQVWVDGTWAGSDSSLSTPHRFDLSDLLTPGSHQITILVDNAKLPPVGPCHQVDERTQTNWNGIVGRIELEVSDPIGIDDVQVYPDPESRRVRVAMEFRNRTSWSGSLDLDVSARLVRDDSSQIGDPAANPEPLHTAVSVGPGVTHAECELELPNGFPLWDEFRRPLARLTVRLSASGRLPRAIEDSRSVTFAVRDFSTVGGQFAVNGRRTFLRGKHDAALFPLTGYAPMDKSEWLRLFGIVMSYGMNHYRFHSWCPPEAAFEAADELGIYMQPELPNKRPIVAPGDPDRVPPREAYETLEELAGPGGDTAERTTYLIGEGERILQAYGNHPSFVMMSLGNELDGDEDVMRSMCDHFRRLDGRHVYSLGTHHHNDDPHLTEGDDFWVTSETGPGKPVRGASFQARTPCHVDNVPPSTLVDYRSSLEGIPIPVIGHEMAQYEVYPDYSEIEKYTGVTRARNLEIFRGRLNETGMGDQALDFFRASGALSAICHREDVEAALRTPGFGGFQMLDLQDFSGQGTALVGMLNVFLESKGLITPEAWREFCCETVPLLRMAKYTWTSDEAFAATISVAHYGPEDLDGQLVSWRIADGEATVAQGAVGPVTILTGDVASLGSIEASLDSVRPPRKLTVSLALDKTPYRNAWDLWMYPPEPKVASDSVRVTRVFDDAVRAALADGEKVLLLPRLESIKQCVGGAFQTSFWCWPMFRRVAINAGVEVAPGTMGILCDPEHPIFDEFPTEYHSNWQWWRLAKSGRPLILDSTSPTYRPIVQVPDNFARNHKLGLICEAKVGKGSLLICSIDLPGLAAHPEARQFQASILRYMESDRFAPECELAPELIAEIV